MLKITDYKLRESLEGKTFFALTLQGEIEIVTSANGGMYATARKCSLPTTFDEATCVSLLGQELPGRVERVECEPYEYTIPQTEEVVLLTHRYEYVNEEQPVQQETIKMYNTSIEEVNAERA